MNILITGASGGIGSSIKDALSNKEFMIFSPSSKELDLRDKKQITHYLNDKLIDGVVHAAGINSVMHASEVDENILIDHLRINTLSLFQICKNIKSESKCINVIAISSLYGIFARINRLPYVLSKHALEGLVKSLSIDLSPQMLVNSISPGFVDTKMTRKNNSAEKIKKIKSKIPTGKLVDAAEIASLVTYLLLNNKSITGQNIIIDGGYSCGGFEK